jgi:hypothetical protein
LRTFSLQATRSPRGMARSCSPGARSGPYSKVTSIIPPYRRSPDARLQREQDPKSPFVFTSERGTPFTTAGFARMIERAGGTADLGFKAHPHMLRHACDYALANKGHDTRALQAYLGHRNIQHTVRYTELSPADSRVFGRGSYTHAFSMAPLCEGCLKFWTLRHRLRLFRSTGPKILKLQCQTASQCSQSRPWLTPPKM